jgi:hypothetical protein
MKPKNLIVTLLLCICLFGCATGPTVHQAGKYMWAEGVPGMYENEADMQKAVATAWPTAGEVYGGSPVVWAWSPEGMAVSAAIANGIRAAKCGR